MANVFITPKQMVEDMHDTARKHVRDLSADQLRQIVATISGPFGVGFGGALQATLIKAADERLKELDA